MISARGHGISGGRCMIAEKTVQKHDSSRLVDLLVNRHDEIINLWIKERLDSGEFRDELIPKNELRRQSEQIIDLLARSIKESGGSDFESPAFDEMREFLNEISRARAVKGYTALENATYILSLRNTLLPLLANDLKGDLEEL